MEDLIPVIYEKRNVRFAMKEGILHSRSTITKEICLYLPEKMQAQNQKIKQSTNENQ